MAHITWTAEQFKEATGQEARQDDLQRCNCPDAGELGHNDCGICEHNSPVFMCSTCFHKPADKVVRLEYIEAEDGTDDNNVTDRAFSIDG